MLTKKRTSNGKALIKTIKQLRLMFHEDYPDGGWLPSLREMSERFGVSSMTYHKAISRMVAENFVQSYPKKGYYVVPEHLRCRKVGLLFEDGVTSPFIGECRNVASILEVLNTNNFSAQVLQVASFDQLYDLALAHGVEGLIWFDPPYQAKQTIHAIDQDDEFPLAVIQLRHFEDDEILGSGAVTYDSKRITEARAKLLKHLGHQHIAYTGRDYEQACAAGVVDTLKRQGIELITDHCIAAPHDEPERLEQLLDGNQVTAIMSEGGGRLIDHLFKTLSSMPNSQRPQVLVSDFPHLPVLLKRYPKVKHVPQPGRQRPDIGHVAATMLLDNILNGKEIKRVKVSESYNIPE